MAWTVNGVIVSDDHGWTAGAAGLVERRKKWANGQMNSGPSGKKKKRFRGPNHAQKRRGGSRRMFGVTDGPTF